MRRWPLFGAGVCLAVGLIVVACASDESASPPAEPNATIAPDATPDGAEAGPCTHDCEYFPEACAPDVLCVNGLFAPTKTAQSIDWRTRVNVIAGRSASDVWIAGALGAVAHFDGTAWAPSDIGTQESQRVLWLLDSGEITFGAVTRIYTRGVDLDGGADASFSAGGWSRRAGPSLPSDFGGRLSTAWSPPGSEAIWLATDQGLWRLRLTPASTFEILPGVPPSVCAVIACQRIRSIHGASDRTVWAVGDLGSAVRITGDDTPVAEPLNTHTWMGLSGVWAASDVDVWAVGGNGTILRYRGDSRSWEVVADVPTNENLIAVGGSSPSDVWAAGDAGVVVHYDGARWSRVKIAGLGSRRPALTTVWTPAPGRVWIGGQGVLLSVGGKP